MDPTTFLPFPGSSPEKVDADLAEIEAGVALVSFGLATRVRLVGLSHVDAIAGAGLAHAQASHVAFALERGPRGAITITLGPRTRGGPISARRVTPRLEGLGRQS
jgi:hypothetical protein